MELKTTFQVKTKSEHVMKKKRDIFFLPKQTCIWLWFRLTFSISMAVVFGVIVEVFGVIVSLSVTFLVNAAFKRLLFGFEEDEEAIFELVRGDCLVYCRLDIFFCSIWDYEFYLLKKIQMSKFLKYIGFYGIFLFISAMFLKLYRLNRANEEWKYKN